jgi:hypothetical protein
MAACEAKNAEWCRVDDEVTREEREERVHTVHRLEQDIALA